MILLHSLRVIKVLKSRNAFTQHEDIIEKSKNKHQDIYACVKLTTVLKH